LGYLGGIDIIKNTVLIEKGRKDIKGNEKNGAEGEDTQEIISRWMSDFYW
jgi:hypothetical protein